MSAIVIWPTDMNEELCLDPKDLLAFINEISVLSYDPAKYAHWHDVLVNNKGWTEELQEDFEQLCADYWRTRDVDEGFFPGASIKEAFASKMRAKAEAPKFSTNKDLRDKESARRVLESKTIEYNAQMQRTEMCRMQWVQSKQKLDRALSDMKAAQARLDKFADAIAINDL